MAIDPSIFKTIIPTKQKIDSAVIKTLQKNSPNSISIDGFGTSIPSNTEANKITDKKTIVKLRLYINF